ncbi:MAG: hypothetical protein M9962_02875 [Oligoflexia bacterium]|nr:hypothetical protein [Oligoflexia bacterium]
MKLLLIAALFISSMQAFASEAEPGLNVNPIPNQSGTVACKEGHKITVIEPTYNDSSVRVEYTCTNGRYVPSSATQTVVCNEGEVINVLEPGQNDAAQWVRYVCRGGKFVR